MSKSARLMITPPCSVAGLVEEPGVSVGGTAAAARATGLSTS